MNEERDYCIYEHIFPNGMVYIGLTKQKPQSRWRGGEGYKKQKKWKFEQFYSFKYLSFIFIKIYNREI